MRVFNFLVLRVIEENPLRVHFHDRCVMSVLDDVCFDIRISAQFIALDRVVKEIFYHFAIDELIAPFDLNSASALEDEPVDSKGLNVHPEQNLYHGHCSQREILFASSSKQILIAKGKHR